MPRDLDSNLETAHSVPRILDWTCKPGDIRPHQYTTAGGEVETLPHHNYDPKLASGSPSGEPSGEPSGDLVET